MADISERLGRIEEKLDGLHDDVKPLVDKVNSHESMWAGLHGLSLHERIHNLRTDVDILKNDKSRREGASKTWLALWGLALAVGTAGAQVLLRYLGAS